MLVDAASGRVLGVGHNRVDAGGALVHAEVDAVRDAEATAARDGAAGGSFNSRRAELLVVELDMDTGGFASAHPCAACTAFLLRRAGLARVWHTTPSRGLVAISLR